MAKQPGRPPKISPEIISAIITAIKAGNYMETAAAFAGISKDTLYRWLKMGARELQRVIKEGGRIKAKLKPYCRLSQEIEKATSEAEIRDVSMISKAAAGANTITETHEYYDERGTLVKKLSITKQAGPQWQAAAWRLERKYPGKWGRNSKDFAPQDIPALVVEEVPMSYSMEKKTGEDEDLDDMED